MLVDLDYLGEAKPRYDKAPHELLWRIVSAGRARYANRLQGIARLPNAYRDIPLNSDGTSGPYWSNGFFSPLDAIVLTGMIRDLRPSLYLEIGSGNSTKFARRAVRLYSPSTKVVSIDPEPRAEVDAICDEVIRQPLEALDLAIFDRLQPGDFLFVDNSHRCLMNSDVTVTFLEVLPRLRTGVVVHIHDVFLPWDYPEAWVGRYYSEQYLLACWLLAGQRFQIELPNTFISLDSELSSILGDVWPFVVSPRREGCSFWLTVR
jgi:hypothetical protein